MNRDNSKLLAHLLAGVSVFAVAGMGVAAQAQEEDPVRAEQQDDEDERREDVVVVTGIRGSLMDSMGLKRDAQGVVDAITAEDIGKFPDTNLAESLQRITGVSIDRSLGEGSSVTVRGFGADFNLVTFNGRQMPTSTLGDGASPPSSRSFDFGNLASEAVSAVEVYKTSRASIPTGGIGATINIRTTRPLEAPGLRATVGVKGVLDESQLEDPDLTPEISGLYSDTFLDDRLGVAVSGSYQHRKGGVAQANVGWRDGYLGSSDYADEWGALPVPGSWNYVDGIENRPGDNDVYAVPQNADYELADFDRKRVNGQLTLQYDFTNNLRATADYTYSRNKVEVNRSTAGVWFDHATTNSAWTDGPVAGPLYDTEFFGATDLAYSGALIANESENKSLGFNLDWQVNDRLNLVLDAHNSTADSRPTNKYGSSVNLGTTVYGISEQTINFENDLPVISFVSGPGLPDPEDVSNRVGSGSSFRNATMRNEITQIRLMGSYEFDSQLIDSVDFGVSNIDNQVDSAYGFIQTDSWGGLGSPADYPDDLFEWVSLPDKFEGISGANDPNMLQGMYRFNFVELAELMEAQFGICSSPATGTPLGPDTCLAYQSTDRDIREKSNSAFLQLNNGFNLFGNEANLSLGVRYEQTDLTSTALQLKPTGTTWSAANELYYTYDGTENDIVKENSYEHFLPSIDFDFMPLDYVKLRASYSQTISRPSYNELQSGIEYVVPFRVLEASGNQGNAELDPYKSDNIDVSAEWYYADDSYVSLGYFRKKVENFIGNGRIDQIVPDVYNPWNGPRADAARAALGASATQDEIRNFIIANYPDTLDASGNPIGLPEDAPILLRTNIPVTSDQTAEFSGLEFAVQHLFGDTGFGVVLNYTLTDSDFGYDNTKPYNEPQFAVPGLSDSANIIAFYDKNGIQVRAAYNWRDEFLSAGGNNPFYVEAYGQLDVNASYEFDNGISLFVEGINVTGEDRRGHRRHQNNVYFMNQGEPRFAFGARKTF